MSTPFRVAIVGCGNIAGRKDHPRDEGFVGTHALAYYRHPKFKIEVAVNPNLEHLKIFQDIWSVPRGYQDLSDMLRNESPDVISLCTPDDYHFKQLEEIIKSNSCPKVIFTEKPVCLDYSELKILENLVNEKGCLLVVNHSRRFDPGHIRLMKFIQDGELGNLLQGRCDYYGGWFHNGCHVVDTLRMLFKQEPVIQSVGLSAPGKVNDPCLDVGLMLGNAPIDIKGFDEKYYQLYESEFRFERGRVLVWDFGSKITVEKVKFNALDERVLVPLEDSPWRGLDSPLYYAVVAIGEFLEDGKSLPGRGVLIDEVAGTVSILWQAMEYLKGKRGDN